MVPCRTIRALTLFGVIAFLTGCEPQPDGFTPVGSPTQPEDSEQNQGVNDDPALELPQEGTPNHLPFDPR